MSKDNKNTKHENWDQSFDSVRDSLFSYDIEGNYRDLFFSLKDKQVRALFKKKWDSVEYNGQAGGFLNQFQIHIDKEIMFPDNKFLQDDYKVAHINNFFNSIPNNDPDPFVEQNLIDKRKSTLAEAVFVGTLAQEDMFRPSAFWSYDLGQNLVEKGVAKDLKTDVFYITALVFKPHQNLQFVVFESTLSYKQLKEEAKRLDSSWGEALFGLDKRKNNFIAHIDQMDGFLLLLNDDDTRIWSADRIDTTEIIDRYIFIRKFCAQISHHHLAVALQDKAIFTDHKRLAYWEKSDSEIPAFTKDNHLFKNLVSVLAEKSFHLFEYYLRDSVGEDLVPLHKIETWIREFILYGDDSPLIFIPEFIANFIKVEKKSAKNTVKDEYEQILMKSKLSSELRNNINIWTKNQLEDSPVQMIQFTNMFGKMEDTEVVEWTEQLYQAELDKLEVFKLWKTLNKKIGEFKQVEPPF
tara:strand:+ start:1949 stop:3343 length:1395 start_codon:yes stop_codon:yes gene_type:complete